jgi:serine/threonine protein phosphatase 1
MFLEPSDGRLIAVGDIHGHLKMLESLIQAIDLKNNDSIIFLGDMVNRGPNSKGVVQYILDLSKQFNIYCICGNHEEMILGAYHGGQSEHKFWCKFGGLNTIISYGVQDARSFPKDHLRFFADCKDYIETPEYIFVHANYIPHVPMNKQNGQSLRWESFNEKSSAHMSGKKVYCGHTPHRNVVNLDHVCCIDTGCGIWVDGKLTGLDVKSGEKWTIKHNLEIE